MNRMEMDRLERAYADDPIESSEAMRTCRLISRENRPLRDQGSGCDHEIMSNSRPALPPDKDKELRMGLGDS